MSNTRIQIKRSSSTAIPVAGSLAVAEPAYSYNSDKLFLGNTAGTGIIEIGGKFYVDMTQAAYAQANAAYAAANNAGSVESLGTIFEQANTARNQANNAYLNSNAAFEQANTARNQANDAYTAANTKFSSSGGTITGNVSIVGNLTLSGNTVFQNVTTYSVQDPLIYLASNNYTSDIVDIGFVANYFDGLANLHTGLFREHVNKEYYLFQGYTEEPLNNHIDPNANGFTIAVLNADLKANNIILGGTNVTNWITASFEQANNAFLKANGATHLAFGTVIVNGTSLVADSNNDTLNITSGNGIILITDAGTDSFNIALSPTGVTPTTYGGAATVGIFTVDTWGRITSASNAAIAISTDAIASGTLPISRGGTGATSFTTNGLLYGQGGSALAVTAAGTEGQVLQASISGVPSFGMLDGGTF